MENEVSDSILFNFGSILYILKCLEALVVKPKTVVFGMKDIF